MKYEIREQSDSTIIAIDNELGLKCELSSFGAGVYSLSFNDVPAILSLEDYDDYKYSHQFFGKTLGVVAGRLKADGMILDNEYHLNKTNGYNYSLHGGHEKSISFKNWAYKIKDSNKKFDVIFSIKTRKNENGFPGQAKIVVTYEFAKTNNSFKILFKGTTPSEATFLSLSNHMYFNFGESDISNHYLKMNCDRVATTDENLLIEGLKPITEVLDFRKSSKLNPRMAKIEKEDFKGTIDDTFLFDDKVGKVTLKNEKMSMTITTDFPTLNIYVDNSMKPAVFSNPGIAPIRRAIALEPQLFVFDRDSITFKKGEIFKHKIEYKFK